MNILFFSSVSPYSVETFVKTPIIGGAEINLRRIAEEFAKLNHNTYYYSNKKGIPLKSNIKGVNIYIYPTQRFPIIHKIIPFFKEFNEKLILLQHQKFLEKIIEKKKIDIIHTYATYPDTFVSLKVARKYNIPVVQRIAGRAWYNLLREKFSLKEKIEWTFNNVDMLLFLTGFLKDRTFQYFRELDFKVSTQYEIIDIGVNYNQIQEIDTEKVKSKYNLSEDQEIILCMGSFKHYSKRQDILIMAVPYILEKIDNFKVIFLGNGPTLQRMKGLANELGIQQKIRFLGVVPHMDLLAMISISKIVAHPTDFEGYSTVMRETLALGKTFLVSDFKPMNDVIKDGYNGVLAENTPKIFAKKIVYILKNDKIRKSIEKNAAKYAEENFDSKINISKYEKLFIDIITENKNL